MNKDAQQRKPRLWRTATTQEKYYAQRAAETTTGVCPLCDDDALQRFTYWYIRPNNFPYDAVASKHDLLLPLRHTTGADFTKEELAELEQLKRTVLNDSYQFIFETLPGAKSIPEHFHLHLIAGKTVD